MHSAWFWEILLPFLPITQGRRRTREKEHKTLAWGSIGTPFLYMCIGMQQHFFLRINSVIRKRVFFLWPKDWHLFHIFFVRGTYVGSITLYSLCFKLTAEILYSYWLGIITHMICWTCVQCITMENIVLREYVRRNRWTIIYKHH